MPLAERMSAGKLEAMSEYPTGRTGLGDQIAAELTRNPNSPRNRAKPVDQSQIKAAIAALPKCPDFPDDVDEMSSEDWTEVQAWFRASIAPIAELSTLLERYSREKQAQTGD